MAELLSGIVLDCAAVPTKVASEHNAVYGWLLWPQSKSFNTEYLLMLIPIWSLKFKLKFSHIRLIRFKC